MGTIGPTTTYSATFRDRRDHASRDQLLCRIRAEFREMPGLRLTKGQAQRLFGIRGDICDRVLAELVETRSLWRDEQGRYVCPGSGI